MDHLNPDRRLLRDRQQEERGGSHLRGGRQLLRMVEESRQNKTQRKMFEDERKKFDRKRQNFGRKRQNYDRERQNFDRKRKPIWSKRFVHSSENNRGPNSQRCRTIFSVIHKIYLFSL